MLTDIWSLHKIILVPILTDWVEIDGLANCNSSLCNSEDRKTFVTLIASDSFTHNTSELYTSKYYFSWLAIRNVKIRDISLIGFCNRRFTSEVLKVLNNLKTIRHLTATYSTSLLTMLPIFFESINSLKLNHTTSLTDSNFELLLPKLIGLRKLDISECITLTDATCTKIAEFLPDLECINVHKCAAMSVDVDFIISACVGLKSHKFYWETDESDVITVLEKCPQLAVIDLSDNDSVTDKTVTKIGDLFDIILTDIIFTGCGAITSPALCLMMSKCFNLKRLYLNGCAIDDTVLIATSLNCHKLLELNLSDCVAVTDNGMCKVIRNCHALKSLDVSGCVLLTDITVLCLANCCPTLTSLACDECIKITDFSMSQLTSKCKHLIELSIRSTPLTEVGLVDLCKDVNELRIYPVDEPDDVSGGYSYTKYARKRRIEVTLRFQFTALLTLRTIVHLCPGLLCLKIYDNFNIVDADFAAILAVCPQLTDISIVRCTLCTIEIISILTNAPCDLTMIVLSPMPELTDDLFIKLVDKHPLQSVNIFQAGLLTDLSVYHLIDKRGAHLKSVTLYNSSLVTDNSVINLVNSCPLLSQLDVRLCVLLTGAILTEISHVSMSIRSLKITGCVGIKRSEVVQFIQCYSLDELKFDEEVFVDDK